jgi:hypothetical protein
MKVRPPRLVGEGLDTRTHSHVSQQQVHTFQKSKEKVKKNLSELADGSE